MNQEELLKRVHHTLIEVGARCVGNKTVNWPSRNVRTVVEWWNCKSTILIVTHTDPNNHAPKFVEVFVPIQAEPTSALALVDGIHLWARQLGKTG